MSTETIIRKPKAPWTASLEGWSVRPEVDDVIAYWNLKVPVMHDMDGTCLKGSLIDHKSRDFLLQAFEANRELGRLQAPRTYDFCQRCVIAKDQVTKPPAPQVPAGSRLPELIKIAAEVASEASDVDPEEVTEIVVEPTGTPDGERLNREAAELRRRSPRSGKRTPTQADRVARRARMNGR